MYAQFNYCQESQWSRHSVPVCTRILTASTKSLAFTLTASYEQKMPRVPLMSILEAWPFICKVDTVEKSDLYNAGYGLIPRLSAMHKSLCVVESLGTRNCRVHLATPPPPKKPKRQSYPQLLIWYPRPDVWQQLALFLVTSLFLMISIICNLYVTNGLIDRCKVPCPTHLSRFHNFHTGVLLTGPV